MKKYKLIKEYPIDLSVGSVVIFDNFFSMYQFEDNNKIIRIGSKFVENYPKFWQQIKEPLFITEDGVPIYEGDESCIVCKKGFTISNFDFFIGDCGETHWYFSNKEAAEKFVDENKPRYSKKDIQDAIGAARIYDDKRSYANTNHLETLLKL